jgi:hypothetical protein
VAGPFHLASEWSELGFLPLPDDEFPTQPSENSPSKIAGGQEKPQFENHEEASEDAEIELEIKKIVEEIVEQHKPRFHSTGVLGPTLIPGELRRMAERRIENRKRRRPE